MIAVETFVIDSSSEALDYAYRVLLEAGGPLHFRELCARAQEMGWQCDAARPHRVIYRAVRADIRREGEASRFRQPSDAHLDLAERHPEYTPLSVVKRKLSERQEQARAELPKRPVTLTCGQCTFISFSGVHEVNQSSGVCDNWENSRRLGVQSWEYGCQHWRVRTTNQRVTDQIKLRENRLVLAKKGLGPRR